MQKQPFYNLFGDSKEGRPEETFLNEEAVTGEESALIGQISFEELFSELRF